MENYLTVLAIPAICVLIGYIYGRNNEEPKFDCEQQDITVEDNTDPK